MLYSLKKRQDMRDQKKSTNKKKLWDNTHPLSPTHTLIWINHPPPIPSVHIYVLNLTLVVLKVSKGNCNEYLTKFVVIISRMSQNIVVLQNIAIVTAKSQSLSYQIKIQPKHKKSRGNNAGQKKLCLVFAAI